MGERSSYVPGTFCAVDLASSNFDGSNAFYTQLLGWEAQQMPPGHEDMVYVPFTLRDRMVAGMFEPQGEMPPSWASYVAVEDADDPEGAKRFYGGIYNGENMNGGMMPLPEPSARPHWLVYFTSADLEASVEKIGQLGGNVVVPPMPAGPGRIAVAQDPQGAFFALFEGEVDP